MTVMAVATLLNLMAPALPAMSTGGVSIQQAWLRLNFLPKMIAAPADLLDGFPTCPHATET